MENFEDRLRRDAEHIRAVVSPELEDRIRASLESTTPLRPETRPRRRSNWFWIASSLTGTVADILRSHQPRPISCLNDVHDADLRARRAALEMVAG